jgi:4-hydroxythreonine-4-phosphate dehydrogenase
MSIIGITVGDPAGVGPELVRAVLEEGYRVIGTDGGGFTPGAPTIEGARAAWDALEAGAAALRAGEIGALVTGPVSKAGLYELGWRWPGVTEFMAERFGVSDNFAMCLTGGGLSVFLVTIHVPLREVAGLLTREEIVRVGALAIGFLERRLRGTGRLPRLAVAGLNPHAGEGGAIGREEIEIIAPAIEELARSCAGRAEITGPRPPDAVFFEALDGQFDGVLCMYHDQGLIPLKLHAFHEGVNVTLGLPPGIIRASPDHGTAFAIAGKGVARADSLRAAIRLAGELIQAPG